jgi:hypothetical protein
MAVSKTRTSGGLKGFFQRAGKSFATGGVFAKESSTWVAQKLARIGFVIATTSIVCFMPLVFEISREGQVRFYSFCVHVVSYFNIPYFSHF